MSVPPHEDAQARTWQSPPSEHDQLAHLVEVEIPALKAERDEAVRQRDTLAEAAERWRIARDAFIGGDYDREADDALKDAEEALLAALSAAHPAEEAK